MCFTFIRIKKKWKSLEITTLQNQQCTNIVKNSRNSKISKDTQVSAKLRSDIAGDTGRKKCKRENAV